jgi:capsule polysaccharide modification protein KpsS
LSRVKKAKRAAVAASGRPRAATEKDRPRRLAFLLGTGYSGEDVLQKVALVEPLAPHEVVVASRIDPDVHLAPGLRLPVRGLTPEDLRPAVERLRRSAAAFEIVHQSPHLARPYTAEERDEHEKWVGVGLGFIASFNRRFYDARRQRESRPPGPLLDYVAGLVAFYRDFFQRHRVDALVCTVEDAELTTAAHFVAQRLGIPIVWQVPARFPRRGVMFYEAFGALLPWTDARTPWSEVEALYTETTVAGEAPRVTQGYWDVASLPRRVRDAFFARPYAAWRRHVLRRYPQEALAVPPVNLWRRIGTHAAKLGRRYGVRRVAERPPQGERYFLFPLHFLEDAHMSFREPFLDQFLLIKQLARSLPTGHHLYVKPHPHYFGTDMSLAELRAAARLPNVRVLDPRLPPRPLLRDATGVVTINSTLGFEALVHGVPVVTLGRDFYCREPFATVVRDRNDLSAALAEVSGRGGPKAPEATRDFVQHVHANSVWVDGRDRSYGLVEYTDADGRAIGSALSAVVQGLPGPRMDAPRHQR